jgi:signal transduction histidine kinase
MGLEAAVEWLTEKIPSQHGISASFETDDRPKPLNEELRILLFQAVRELLVNVVKHAQARRVKVSTWREGGQMRLQVADDGKGFQVSETGPRRQKHGGFGLFSIRERLRPWEGRLEVDSQPGAGTRVTVSVPLQENAQPEVNP